MVHTQENVKMIFFVVLLTKLFVLTINSVKKLFSTEEKNVVYKYIEAILSEYNYCKKIIKKHFNKNLVMSSEEEERFQLSNIC